MNNLNLAMEWKRIPKDKFGFFTDNGTMYADLPVIVAEEYDEDMYPILHYVDEENWLDSVSDFSRQRYKYYLPTPPIQKDSEKQWRNSNEKTDNNHSADRSHVLSRADNTGSEG